MLAPHAAALRAAALVSRRNVRTAQHRYFTVCSTLRSYEDTRQNMKIGPHTRVMYQGFTGRVATANAQQSLEYGTQIVGGTTPGKSGEHIGLPLLPSVREAMQQLKPDATAVFVAATHATKAIEDAIEAEIPLIVAVAEFMPLHDVLRLSSILKTQSKSRFVGANAPGIIAPLGNCRIGFQPLPCYSPGHIGVIAKSGTLSYETVGSLTRAGLGQSLCIGMGGDIVAGTNFVDALEVFEHDSDTEAIILCGEIGGRAELDAAEWIKEYRQRSSNPKPIAACVGGVRAMPDRIMGHAGAFASLGEVSAVAKHKALEDAGATMVSHPAKFGGVMKRLLSQAGRDVHKIQRSAGEAAANQRRGFHSMRRPASEVWRPAMAMSTNQDRRLHVLAEHSKKMLADRGIKTAETAGEGADRHFLGVTVDRSNRCPALIVSPTADPSQVFTRAKTFSYGYNDGPNQQTIKAAIAHLQMDAAPPAAMASVAKLIEVLVDIFKSKEAYALSTYFKGTQDGNIEVDDAKFSFDNSAYVSAKRQQDIHALRDTSKEDADEVEAEKSGIIFVKLDDPQANIGTLINGAGLAMNATDALSEYGARPTNFLDTGGKATSETIKKAFEVLLRDERVKVIFVNIFGGLTLCDMIAEGILLAFKDLDMKIPIVVRLRGTNEEKGQKIIADSGLPLHAFDDFGEAAQKCIELTK